MALRLRRIPLREAPLALALVMEAAVHIDERIDLGDGGRERLHRLVLLLDDIEHECQELYHQAHYLNLLHLLGTALLVPELKVVSNRISERNNDLAVTNAVMQAKENDVVLLAGKGHEDYQIVGNRRLDYSDRVTVARLLGAVA